MVEYTDDFGEMDGASANGPFLKLSDLLPGAPPPEQWPIRVVQTRADGVEETVSYQHSGDVRAVRMGKNHDIILEYPDGRTVIAHLAKDFSLLNELEG